MIVADLPPLEQEGIVCSISASVAYGVPADIMLAIAEIEGGTPGTFSVNQNKSNDYGYMQFNSAYLSDLSKKYGEDFGKEYGWARKYLKNANFTEIVKQSKINQHMILQYKWSCGYVHGNANNLYTNLAYLQSHQNIYDDLTITDMSCYGFTEPLQLTCLCLIDILSDLYLCDRRKRKDLVVLSVFMHYCKDIAKKCSKIEDELKKDDKIR